MLFFSGFWVSLCVREREREQRAEREFGNGGEDKEPVSFLSHGHTGTFHTYGALAKTTIYRNTRILEKELFWEKKMISMGLLFKEKGFGSKDPMVFSEMTKVLRKEGLY